ncbi:MAG: excinuclease ABC subunit UvrC [bacterium]
MKPPERVQAVLDNLPAEPGVYLLKSSGGEVLYVGKASSLKDRLPDYFRDYERNDARRQALAERVEDIETIVVGGEQEALELEYDLIKEYRPRYNVAYRDDKSYPYIKITDEVYPRVYVTRNRKQDGSQYFGPYTNVGSMRRILETVREIFPYRSCSHALPAGGDPEKFSLCLDYDIKQCLGPCVGKQSVEDYREMIEDLIEFLKGNYQPVKKRLKERMEDYSGRKEFEAAAVYRDRYRALQDFMENSSFVESTENADVLGVGEAQGVTSLVLLRIRGHRVVTRLEFPLENEALDHKEALQDFILTFYPAVSVIPELLLVETDLPENQLVENKLSELAGKSVRIKVPRIGEKKNLVNSAIRTAELAATNKSISARRREGDLLAVIQDMFDLSEIPRVVEGFDISTHGGKRTVGSMVRFINGQPEKEGYRRYKVNQGGEIDDYAALNEVVFRRYRRLLEEDRPLPELVLVDGGRGQLKAARKALEKLGCELPVISLAKEEELLFIADEPAPRDLPENSRVLQFFQRVRDEAHRFAITYHQDRRQGQISSGLEQVKGIGQARLQRLLQEFGSPARVRQASVDELTEIAGITQKIARRIKQLEPLEDKSKKK